MKNMLIISLVFAMLFLGSCQKDAEFGNSQIEKKLVTKELVKEENTTYSEATNDFEFIGIEHNVILEATTDLESFPDHSLLEVHEMVITEFVENSEQYFTFGEMNEIFQNVVEMENLERLGNYYLDQGFLSFEAAAHLAILNSIVIEHEEQEALIQELLQFENELMGNESLEEFEKSSIIGTSVVLRYSSAYWDIVYSDPNNEWLGFNKGASGTLQRGLWKKIKRALADAGGFLGGAAYEVGTNEDATLGSAIDAGIKVGGTVSASCCK